MKKTVVTVIFMAIFINMFGFVTKHDSVMKKEEIKSGFSTLNYMNPILYFNEIPIILLQISGKSGHMEFDARFSWFDDLFSDTRSIPPREMRFNFMYGLIQKENLDIGLNVGVHILSLPRLAVYVLSDIKGQKKFQKEGSRFKHLFKFSVGSFTLLSLGEYPDYEEPRNIDLESSGFYWQMMFRTEYVISKNKLHYFGLETEITEVFLQKNQRSGMQYKPALDFYTTIARFNTVTMRLFSQTSYVINQVLNENFVGFSAGLQFKFEDVMVPTNHQKKLDYKRRKTDYYHPKGIN